MTITAKFPGRCSECEIEGCGRAAVGTVNGIGVCERCRIAFESAGMGAVRFGGRYHGVIGARYSAEQIALCSGVELAEEV